MKWPRRSRRNSIVELTDDGINGNTRKSSSPLHGLEPVRGVENRPGCTSAKDNADIVEQQADGLEQCTGCTGKLRQNQG